MLHEHILYSLWVYTLGFLSLCCFHAGVAQGRILHGGGAYLRLCIFHVTVYSRYKHTRYKNTLVTRYLPRSHILNKHILDTRIYLFFWISHHTYAMERSTKPQIGSYREEITPQHSTGRYYIQHQRPAE